MLQAFCAGDAGAFDALYARHADWLYRVISRQVNNSDLTEDIFQETWLSLIRSAETWRPEAKLTTWIYRLARSRLVDELRRIKPDSGAAAFKDQDGDEFDPLDQIPDWRFEPAGAAERQQMIEHLARGLEQLPSAQREVFLLWAEAQMSVPDLAQCVDAPLEAVKSRLRYARGKLATWMKDWQS